MLVLVVVVLQFELEAASGLLVRRLSWFRLVAFLKLPLGRLAEVLLDAACKQGQWLPCTNLLGAK